MHTGGALISGTAMALMDVLGSGVGVVSPLLSGAILQYFGVLVKSQISGTCMVFLLHCHPILCTVMLFHS
jgi:hypothetical protein